MTKTDTALDLLGRIAAEYEPAALASSLGAEDMVLTDLALRNGLGIEIFVLDTGRLHGDTLDMLGRIERRYGYAVRVMQPDPAAVAEYVQGFGRDAFYGSVELRKRCCAIRKRSGSWSRRRFAARAAFRSRRRCGSALRSRRVPLPTSPARRRQMERPQSRCTVAPPTSTMVWPRATT